MKKKYAVTGANGFIGNALYNHLVSKGDLVRAIVRDRKGYFDECVEVGDIGVNTDWFSALEGIDVLFHCAGRAHILVEKASDPLAEFRRINRDATVELVRSAAKIGVRRVVFLSSVGVMGMDSNNRLPFSENDKPSPVWDYAVSKLEAEELLKEVSVETGIEVVIVRPPMVYGPGVPANFLRLLQIVDKNIPLPLGGVRNKRSIVSIYNLVDFLVYLASHPAAAGGCFFVSDDHDLSTPDLIRRIGKSFGKRVSIFPVPEMLLKIAGMATGRGHDVERLLSSLQVDIKKAKDLGWSPVISLDDALEKTVGWYRGNKINFSKLS